MKLLKFSTPACNYCKIISPNINAYAEAKGYEVEEVDASKDIQASREYGILGVPAIVILDEAGEQVGDTLIGAPNIMQYINE